MKTLRWHIGGVLEVSPHTSTRDTGVSEQFRLERSYKPKELRMAVRGAPAGSQTTVDVLDDGVSIFTIKPQFSPGETRRTRRAFKDTGPARMAEGSVVAISITSIGSGYAGDNLSVELDLEE